MMDNIQEECDEATALTQPCEAVDDGDGGEEQASLRIKYGDGTVEVFRLRGGANIVGRSAECDVALCPPRCPRVSLKHLTIHVGSRIDGHRRYSSVVASSTTNKTEIRRGASWTLLEPGDEHECLEPFTFRASDVECSLSSLAPGRKPRSGGAAVKSGEDQDELTDEDDDETQVSPPRENQGEKEDEEGGPDSLEDYGPSTLGGAGSRNADAEPVGVVKTLVPDREGTHNSSIDPQEPAAGRSEESKDRNESSEALTLGEGKRGRDGSRSSGSIQRERKEGEDGVVVGGGRDDCDQGEGEGEGEGEEEEEEEGSDIKEGDEEDEEKEEYSETPSIKGGRRGTSCSDRGRNCGEDPSRESGEGTERSPNDEEEAHNRLGGDTLPYQRQTLGWDDESPPRSHSLHCEKNSQGAQSQGAQNMSQDLGGDSPEICMGTGRRVQPERGGVQNGDRGEGDEGGGGGNAEAGSRLVVEEEETGGGADDETIGDDVDEGQLGGDAASGKEGEAQEVGGKGGGKGESNDSCEDPARESAASNEHPGYYGYVPSASLDKEQSVKEPLASRPIRNQRTRSKGSQPGRSKAHASPASMPSKQSQDTKPASKDGSCSESDAGDGLREERGKEGEEEEGEEGRENEEEGESAFIKAGEASKPGVSEKSILGTEESTFNASESNTSPRRRRATYKRGTERRAPANTSQDATQGRSVAEKSGTSAMTCWLHEAEQAKSSNRKRAKRVAGEGVQPPVDGHKNDDRNGDEDEDEDEEEEKEEIRSSRRSASAVSKAPASKAPASASSACLGKRKVRGGAEPSDQTPDSGLGKRRARGRTEAQTVPHDEAQKKRKDIARDEPGPLPLKRRRPYQAEPVSAKESLEPAVPSKRPGATNLKKGPDSPALKKGPGSLKVKKKGPESPSSKKGPESSIVKRGRVPSASKEEEEEEEEEPCPTPSARRAARGKPESSPKTSQGQDESSTTPGRSTRCSQAGGDAKRILFVGGSADGQAKLERIVEKLGGEVVTDAVSCTHVVMDRIKTSPNLLAVLAREQHCHLVTRKWITACGEQSTWARISPRYSVPQREDLKQYAGGSQPCAFSLESWWESRPRGGVFAGITFWWDASCDMKRVPDAKQIVEAGGGVLLGSAGRVRPDTIVLAGGKETSNSLRKRLGQARFYTVQFLKASVLSQRLLMNEGKIR